MTWKNPRPGDLSAEGLRETLTSLESYLADLSTALGVVGGTYDGATGVTSGATSVTTAADVAALDVRLDVVEAAWTSWTPTPGGITLGNGSITGGYLLIGKTCIFRHRLSWGSTTSLAGSMTLTLPFTPIGAGAAAGRLYDNSANGAYTGGLVWGTSTLATYAGDPGVVTATTPFTWATNDYAITTGIIETT